MGESKRRKEILGDEYGKEKKTILPGIPVTKQQSRQFMTWTTRGAWIGIGTLAFTWIMIRFIGPAFGWWTTN
ncbi:MAG: DUF2839 domain-containing protein [Cyanophyceae cyanobacterium]